jgi:hypothetical protein
MEFTSAEITIRGTSPMGQSHGHGEPKLEGESHGDHDLRTWRSKLNVEIRDGKKTVVIPGHGMHQCIAAAARYSKRQIPNQGKATWTAKFTSGIMITESPSLNIDPATVNSITISANADGKRGSGTRVPRILPQIAAGWVASFTVIILDPIITESVFKEMMDLAGLFIGIGQFRPEKGGHNGRFCIDRLVWHDHRQIAA